MIDHHFHLTILQIFLEVDNFFILEFQDYNTCDAITLINLSSNINMIF